MHGAHTGVNCGCPSLSTICVAAYEWTKQHAAPISVISLVAAFASMPISYDLDTSSTAGQAVTTAGIISGVIGSCTGLWALYHKTAVENDPEFDALLPQNA